MIDGGEVDEAGRDGGPPADSGPLERDSDGDGFDPLELGGEDCDDTDPTINPRAVEVCGDGVDQDCDGADLSCEDADADGDGYTPATGDCDDGRAGVNPAASEIPYNGLDDDCNPATPDDDLDGDGYGRLEDCDDEDADVHPGATETPYDGIDQDCRGGDLTDVDGDGYAAVVAGGRDCDDDDASVHPAAVDVCGDGVDQNCDGTDPACTSVDRDGDGYSPIDGDCDDDDPAVHPGATEVPYDGRDNDCDATTPDDDLDGDGYRRDAGDCDDSDPTIHPSATDTPYDGIDQDCSGADLVDVDGDGYASDMVSGGTDCDDTRAWVHPGADEIPYDSVDDDCDGSDTIDRDTLLDIRGATDIGADFGLVGGSEGYFAAYGSEGALIARGLDATGAPIGTRAELVPSSTGFGRVVLARAAADRYLVAWSESNRLRAAWLDQTGNVLAGGAFTIVDEAVDAVTGSFPFAAGGDGSGNVVVLFGDRDPDPAVHYATGAATSTAFSVSTSTGSCGDGYGGSTWVSPASSGFLVACGDSTSGTEAHYLSTSGVPSTAHAVSSFGSGPAVAWNGTAHMVALSSYWSSTYGVRVRRVTALPPTATEVELESSTSQKWAARIASVGSRWIVVYQDRSFSPTVLSARWLDSSGTPTGSAFILDAPGVWVGPVKVASAGSSALVLAASGEGWVTMPVPAP